MTRDTIFRAFSMTKPVTAVAMMLLYEQGKWLPTDPIAKYIPEFAQLKVFKSVDSSGQMVLEDSAHAPTMQQLMSHTAGFTYGFFGDTPVDKAYQAAGVMQSDSLQGMIDKLAKLPLLYQPGTRWMYSLSMDVQGYIIEKLSGQSLPEFMERNIFTPLGMKDSGFDVPADKRSRFATMYRGDEKGQMITDPPGRGFRRRVRQDARDAVRWRWSRHHCRRLLPLRPDARQQRSVERCARTVTGVGEADEREPLAASAPDRRVRDRATGDAARLRLRLQLCRRLTIRQWPTCPTAKGRSSGTARPAHGSGWIRPTIWSLSA